MLTELNQLIESKDVIVLTSMNQAALAWSVERYTNQTDVEVVENAHQLETANTLQCCRESLADGKKVILTA